MNPAEKRIQEALRIADEYGSIDGSHHKMWVIDQMVQALTKIDYPVWVATHKAGEDGAETYNWDTGIPP